MVSGVREVIDRLMGGVRVMVIGVERVVLWGAHTHTTLRPESHIHTHTHTHTPRTPPKPHIYCFYVAGAASDASSPVQLRLVCV